jgi:hypothetical protein
MKRAPPGLKHAKLCQCQRCVAQRFAAYQDRIDSYLKMGIVPRSAAQTVMVKKYTVKPHFRRNSTPHGFRQRASRRGGGVHKEPAQTEDGRCHKK